MDLAKIRKEIDATDDQILSLFLKRMELCVGVAKYKKENNMQVFQGKREQEILERIKSKSPDDLAEGAGQLFTCIMDISKCGTGASDNILCCKHFDISIIQVKS